MKRKIFWWTVLGVGLSLMLISKSTAYPPAVGIVGKSVNCLDCHVNNGPWTDEDNTIIDILDKETQESLHQGDGSFLIGVRRGEVKTVVTVIGRKQGDEAEAPYRNAWVYVDKTRIRTDSLSKFAPGWSVNLPMACRIVGDELEGFEKTRITALPMSLRPGDDAQDAELSLQVMLTKGESVKGKADEGMKGNYFERLVRLKVID